MRNPIRIEGPIGRMTGSVRHGLLFLLLWCLTQAALAGEQGLLWRVEKAGVAPSYLFGTIHSEDPRVTALPEAVREGLGASRVLLLELDLGSPELALVPLVQILPPGQSLDRLLPPDMYRDAIAAMTQRGFPEASTNRLRPWAIVIYLSVPPVKTGLFVDVVLYQQALAQGVTIAGLERASEQIAVFEALSLAEQRELLAQALALQPGLDAWFEAMHQAYLARDLAALQGIADDTYGTLSPEMGAKFERLLVTERNHRMAERARPYLAAGGAFIAVGALHLPGESGLIRQFEVLGYRVTPVY